MLKNYLLSTCSHQVLDYMVMRNMIDKLEAQRAERHDVRLKRVLHEKAAKQQGVSV